MLVPLRVSGFCISFRNINLPDSSTAESMKQYIVPTSASTVDSVTCTIVADTDDAWRCCCFYYGASLSQRSSHYTSGDVVQRMASADVQKTVSVSSSRVSSDASAEASNTLRKPHRLTCRPYE